MNSSINQLLNHPQLDEYVANPSDIDQNRGSLNIEKVKKAIDFAEKNIRTGQDGKHVVIFWGYTGTGKSTSIIILNGQKVYGYDKNGVSILTNNLNQQEEKQVKKRLKKGEVVIFIQESVESGTVHPCSLPMKIREKQEQIIMWDTPGFGDNKGITQTLINTYFIHRLFNLQQQVKLVLTINFNDLITDQKGDRLKRVIKTISQALGKFKNYQKSMALLITKATQTASTQGVLNLFQQNMKLNYVKEDQQIKKFFKNVCQKKIPIIVIKRPKLTQMNDKNNPKDVTKDYKEFTQDFYNKIINLGAAIVPNLKAPGMTQEEIQKCIKFGKQVRSNINILTMKMNKKLQTFIQKQYNLISFGDNLDINKHSLDIIVKMKEFEKSLNEKISKKCQTKIQYHKNYEQLTDLFQEPKINFQCEVRQNISTCTPMREIKNLIIIIDFISSINIPEEQFQYQKVMKDFFQMLKLKMQELTRKFYQLEKEAQKKYFQYISKKFDEQLLLWREEKLFKQWKKTVKFFPSLYFRIGSSSISGSGNLLQYFQEVKLIQNGAQFKCTEYLQPLLQLFRYNRQLEIFDVNHSQFIQTNLKTIIINHQKKLKQDLDISNWNDEQISQIKVKKPRIVLLQIKNRDKQNNSQLKPTQKTQNYFYHYSDTKGNSQTYNQLIQDLKKEKKKLQNQKQQLIQENQLKQKQIIKLQGQKKKVEQTNNCCCCLII